MSTEYEGKFPNCTSCGGKGSYPCSVCTGGEPDCGRCEGTNHETCAECEHREARIRHWRPDEIPDVVRDESVPIRIVDLTVREPPAWDRMAEEYRTTPAFQRGTDPQELLGRLRDAEARLGRAHEALANVVRRCVFGCTRDSYCGSCGAAYAGLPEDYDLG